MVVYGGEESQSRARGELSAGPICRRSPSASVVARYIDQASRRRRWRETSARRILARAVIPTCSCSVGCSSPRGAGSPAGVGRPRRSGEPWLRSLQRTSRPRARRRRGPPPRGHSVGRSTRRSTAPCSLPRTHHRSQQVRAAAVVLLRHRKPDPRCPAGRRRPPCAQPRGKRRGRGR